MNPVDVIDLQNEIITTQSEIIDGLFLALAKYSSLDDIMELPPVKQIRDVAFKLEELRRTV